MIDLSLLKFAQNDYLVPIEFLTMSKSAIILASFNKDKQKMILFDLDEVHSKFADSTNFFETVSFLNLGIK